MSCVCCILVAHSFCSRLSFSPVALQHQTLESPLGSRSLLFVSLHGLPGCLLPSSADQVLFAGFSSKLVPSLHILSPAWKTPCHSQDRAEVVASSLLPSHPLWEGPKCNDTQQIKRTSSIPYFLKNVTFNGYKTNDYCLKPRKEKCKAKSESEMIILKSLEVHSLSRRVTYFPVIGVRSISKLFNLRTGDSCIAFSLLNTGLLYKMVPHSLHYLYSYLYSYIFILYSVPNYVY